MAITRTDINGDIAALKAALETLVPDFFATVEFDNDTSPTTVICKDADGNTTFTVSGVSGSTTYAAYKNATTSASASSTDSNSSPLYFYKVGSNGAVIQCKRSGTLIIIGKTNTGVTGFALPNALGSNLIANLASATIACWGDDPALTGTIRIAEASGAQLNGNHTLFVPIPMHGTYAENIYLPKAFFLPMTQDGMRGVVQELTADEGTYLTNGYVALLDDSVLN